MLVQVVRDEQRRRDVDDRRLERGEDIRRRGERRGKFPGNLRGRPARPSILLGGGSLAAALAWRVKFSGEGMERRGEQRCILGAGDQFGAEPGHGSWVRQRSHGYLVLDA
jgi:hypothetical protein